MKSIRQCPDPCINLSLGVGHENTDSPSEPTPKSLGPPGRSPSGLEGGPLRRLAAKVLTSEAMELVVAVLTIATLATIIADADARAEEAASSHELQMLLQVFLVIQILEFTARIFVERCRVLRSAWNVLDLVVILSSTLDLLLQAAGGSRQLSGLRALRLLRVARLLRAACRLPFLRELRKLVLMAGSCARAALWSAILLSLALAVWSVLMVEMLHPLVRDLAEAGAWSGCERCPRAFSSVFQACLTLFSTAIAGDSWGVVAIPVIEAHPWTLVIFGGSVLTLTFGVLNLIVAVVVDTFAEARANDPLTRARERFWEGWRDTQILLDMFSEIDANHDGAIEQEELLRGTSRSATFGQWLEALNIESSKLNELFKILDLNGDGQVDVDEFVEVMCHLKSSEAKAASCFVEQKVAAVADHQKRADDTICDVRSAAALLPQLRKGLAQVSDELAASEEHMRDQLKDQEAAITRSLEVYVQAALTHALGTASTTALPTVLRKPALLSDAPAEQCHSTYSKEASPHPMRWRSSERSDPGRSPSAASRSLALSSTASRRSRPKPKVPCSPCTGPLLVSRPRREAQQEVQGEGAEEAMASAERRLQETCPSPEGCARSPQVNASLEEKDELPARAASYGFTSSGTSSAPGTASIVTRASTTRSEVQASRMRFGVLRELAEELAPGVETQSFPTDREEFLQALAKLRPVSQSRLNQCLTKHQLPVAFGPSKMTKLQLLYDAKLQQKQAEPAYGSS